MPAASGVVVAGSDALDLTDEERLSCLLSSSPLTVVGDGECIDSDCFFDSDGEEWCWSTGDEGVRFGMRKT